jgi:hypothetical protein
MKKLNFMLVAMLFTTVFAAIAQEDEPTEGSVIQTLTPSKLIGKGQFDIKWFNNLYTETRDTFGENGEEQDIPRNTFFTATVEAYTGISPTRRVNVGLILEVRSTVIGGRDALDVFSFDGETNSARSGITSIAPSVKFVPFTSVNNFSIQSSFFIPLVDNEVENEVFLDQKGFTWQNRFFYDYTFGGGDWQLFADLNSELNFGDDEESFANDSVRLTSGLFLSYFPSPKFTVLGLVQHSQLVAITTNGFEQDFTAIGGGVKYQLTEQLNLEALYTNFVRGNDTGLGQTFNLGVRAVF